MNLRTAAPSVFLSVLLFIGCTSDTEKAREALARGRQLLAARTLDDAALSFAAAARLDPALHEAHARLARVRLEQGRARDAETAALRAASLVPRSAYYSELLGRTQLAGQQLDGAIASMEQAITLAPAETARLAFTVGVLRERQDKPVEAQAAYERAATADASAILPRLALARLHLRADRLDDAKRRLDEVRLRVPAAGGEHALFAQLDARVTALEAEREAKRRAEAERAVLAMREQILGSSGILALLGGMGRDSSASIWTSGAALGSDSGLGSLRGDWIGDSFGFGGLGLRGTGMGGGGTGEGTIGLGNIGTIGHGGGGGSGMGYGSGGMGGLSAHRAPAPTVTLGTAAVAGPLSADIIQRVVRRHTNELRFCYESALRRNPAVQGRVSASFVIDATGAVTTATATGLGDATAESCVANAMRRWTFPAPDGGGVVRVTYPINLAPPAPTPAAAPAPAPAAPD